MAVQRRWQCGAVMTHFEGAREKTAQARPTRARAKEARMEKVAKVARGGRGKSNGKGPSKGKGDPLKQRLVSRTQYRLCGEDGHWEEDCPEADVDMPTAKRRVTFSTPPVGVDVSQAWGVETWTVSPSTESAETRLKTWTSQEIQESTNLMGVTMTMPEGQSIWDCGAALDCIGEVAAARTAQAITIQRFKFGGGGDPVEASFAVTLPVQIGDSNTWIEALVFPGSTPHLISRRGGSLSIDVW